MSLNLYRRHRQECEGGHPEESRSGEFEERKKGWKRCGCFIFASGTLNGTFKRKYTGKTNWDEAKAIAATWETAASWAGEPPAPSRDPDPPAPDPAPKITIEQGVTAFL